MKLPYDLNTVWEKIRVTAEAQGLELILGFMRENPQMAEVIWANEGEASIERFFQAAKKTGSSLVVADLFKIETGDIEAALREGKGFLSEDERLRMKSAKRSVGAIVRIALHFIPKESNAVISMDLDSELDRLIYADLDADDGFDDDGEDARPEGEPKPTLKISKPITH